MKSNYKTFLFLLIFPMAFGYNPVMDTLSKNIELDFLTGQSPYYTGCESPVKTMAFQEVHAGYKTRVSDRVTLHIDGGLVPTDVEPIDAYGGGNALFGYVVGGFDVDWEYFGTGLGLGNGPPVFDPYLRLGSKKILYLDAGFDHRFPLASTGNLAIGVGSGFGTDKLNVWLGMGGNLQFGGLDNSEYGGYGASMDLRVSEAVAVKFGGLYGDNNSKSAWLGLRYYFK